MAEYVERESLLSEYDRQHDGEPGKARELIANAPAADVVPVRHGHWVWDEDGMDWGIGSWRCSECYTRPETWWQGDRSSPYNKSGHYYCPNCGATMSGGNDV